MVCVKMSKKAKFKVFWLIFTERCNIEGFKRQAFIVDQKNTILYPTY